MGARERGSTHQQHTSSAIHPGGWWIVPQAQGQHPSLGPEQAPCATSTVPSFHHAEFPGKTQAEQVSMDNTHTARVIHHTSSGRAAATAGVDVNPRWNIVRNFLTSWCGSATHAGTAWEPRQRPGSRWKARGIVEPARKDIRLVLRLARPAEERIRAPRRGMLDSMPTRRQTRRKDIITATAAPASVVPWFDQ